MVGTVRSRANHYETLGLTPTATSDEIGEAFVRQISGFHPRAFGGVLLVSVAYETLRDPIKRRDYDALIGIRSKPEQSRSPTARWEGAPSLGLVEADAVERPAIETLPPPAPELNSKLPSEPPAERTLGSFIAASLRDPVNTDSRRDTSAGRMPRPEQLHRPRADARPRPAPNIRGDQILNEPGQRLPNIVVGPIGSKPTAAALGAFLLAVGLLSVWAGWDAGNDIESQQPQHTVTRAIPPARAFTTTTGAPPAPAPSVKTEQPDSPTPAVVATARIEPSPLAQKTSASIEQQSESPGSQQQLEDSAPEEAIAESAPAAVTAPRLPLPNSVIARIIERIGFACGQVASIAPEGETPDVYKITCVSGESYQARPVNGRYRFRRSGSR